MSGPYAGSIRDKTVAIPRLLTSAFLARLDPYIVKMAPSGGAPDAYKYFYGVLSSVEKAGLASMVAGLKARFVIKDGDTS